MKSFNLRLRHKQLRKMNTVHSQTKQEFLNHGKPPVENGNLLSETQLLRKLFFETRYFEMKLFNTNRTATYSTDASDLLFE